MKFSGASLTKIDLGRLLSRAGHHVLRFALIRHWRAIEALMLLVAIGVASYMMYLLFLPPSISESIDTSKSWELDKDRLQQLKTWRELRVIEQRKQLQLDNRQYFITGE